MNTELEDRLQALGAHLDAERAAHTDLHTTVPTTNVVSLDSHRRTRALAAAAAVVLVAAGITAIAVNRGGSPDPTTPVTDPTTVTNSSTVETTIVPSTVAVTTGDDPNQVGTIDVMFSVPSGDQGDVVDRLTSRATAMGLGATVTVENGLVHVVAPNVRNGDVGSVIESLRAVQDAVQLRPVTGNCVPGNDSAQASDPTATQLLPVVDPEPQSCTVGPSTGTGAVFERDAALQPIDGEPSAVVVSLRPGADGTDVWNTLAGHCYDKDTTCPTGQLAVELSGRLYAASTVQTPVFEGSVMIAGAFDEAQANVLIDALLHDDPSFRLEDAGYDWTAADG